MAQTRKPKAFVSCSLRPEDKPFVDLVEQMTSFFGLEPMGTVGRHAAAPAPIPEQMKQGIATADCLVLAATKRYVTEDVHNGAKGNAIGEMLHVEVGMAVASGRPVLCFVEEGTNVGGFLPQAVQYITLRPNDIKDLEAKTPLIRAYFARAIEFIEARWGRERQKAILDGGLKVLGAVGAVTITKSIVESFATDDDGDLVRCKATTASGDPCRYSAIEGNYGFCGVHRR